MSLVAVARPCNEPQLAVMIALLETTDIPYVVQGRHFGSLWPGVQVASYNTRRILVPAARSTDARACLASLLAPPPSATMPARPRLRTIARMLVEWLAIGWCVPPTRSSGAIRNSDADD